MCPVSQQSQHVWKVGERVNQKQKKGHPFFKIPKVLITLNYKDNFHLKVGFFSNFQICRPWFLISLPLPTTKTHENTTSRNGDIMTFPHTHHHLPWRISISITWLAPFGPKSLGFFEAIGPLFRLQPNVRLTVVFCLSKETTYLGRKIWSRFQWGKRAEITTKSLMIDVRICKK